MPELPSHASPYFSPQSPGTGAVDSELSLDSTPSGTAMATMTTTTTTVTPSLSHHAGSRIEERRHHDEEPSQDHDSGTESDRDRGGISTPALPASFLSPAFTPPATPGGTLTPARQLLQSQLNDIRQQHQHQHQGSDLSHVAKKAPKLLAQLPNVECIVRARIPTTTGAEMFLHLYHNDIDNKEHLAIVFGNTIRSRSLDRVRPGETEMDRMIRGAYVGKLHPGRISSWYDSEQAQGSTTSSTGTSTGSGSSEISRAMKPMDGSDGPVRPTTSHPQHQAPLVRIHSECYTGETAWSARCDCGEQLDEAARLMSFPNETWGEGISSSITTDPTSEPGTASSHLLQPPTTPGGVIIYLRQEGRGIGLGEKLKAYNLQDLGSDTVEANLLLRHPADARSYGLATAMLVDLGLGVDGNPEGIRLLTNNPDKVRAVEGANREVRVKERVPMIPLAWRTGGKRGIKSSEVEGYLRTKIAKMGHMIQ